MKVAFQNIAFKEPGLYDTLDAWADQPVPGFVDEITYESWITPSREPKEACQTWQQAEEHPVFEAFEAPKYKLRARNAAHDDALARGVDVVVVADADAPPLRKNTLTALLRRQSEPTVAAVCSDPVSPTTVSGVYSNVKTKIRETAFKSIHGQCHSMTAEAWRHAGPFSDDIDHTHLQSVWKEEEWGFGKRLREVGDVVYESDAPVYDDTRRLDCRWRRKILRRDVDDYCQKPDGQDTFSPR